MKLDSEEQRQQLLGIIRQLPVTQSNQQGQVVPFTVGDVERGLPMPENIAPLLRAVKTAELDQE